MSELDRRNFLKSALVAGAGLGAVAGAAKPARADGDDAEADTAPYDKVPTKELGKTGAQIPILLVGCAQRFDKRYDRILHKAFEEGVNYLDTALVYANGMSHRTLAPFIKQVGRDKLWITSKAPHYRKRADVASFEKDLETCLEQMEIEHLDLFFMHQVDDLKYLQDEYIQMGQRLKESGKTRFFGFSCHDGNVVELLNRAAEIGPPGIDAIMFRYNFAQYGNDELNRAIDACKEAGVGLIAMKTQNSIPGDLDAVKQFQSRDFTVGQAKMKSVWADDRIDAAVSHMDNLEVLNENLDAAKSKVKISMNDFHQLQRMHRCTSAWACQGCNHLCESRIDGEVRVADALRFLMYHEAYGEQEKAKQLYRELPMHERSYEGVDFGAAKAACPAGIDIPARLERARELLA